MLLIGEMEDLEALMKKEIKDLYLTDAVNEHPTFIVCDNGDPVAIACIDPNYNMAIALTASQCRELISKLQEIINKYER